MKQRTMLTYYLLIALLQLIVVGYGIFASERILRVGTVLNIPIEGRDPEDLFRGNFVYLNFAESSVEMPNDDNLSQTPSCYVEFTVDENDIAHPKALYFKRPNEMNNVVKVLDCNRWSDDKVVHFNYPVKKLFANKEKAESVEDSLNQQSVNTDLNYAKFRILNGEMRLEGLVIDNQSMPL